jgi:hypothetical protein
MEDVAKAFVEHYYKTLDANPDGLGTIYVRDVSRVEQNC